MFEIEKRVEIPEAPVGRPQKYPWIKMGVGDSFFIPREELNSGNASQLWRHRKAYGESYVSRKEEGGWRIWRTK